MSIQSTRFTHKDSISRFEPIQPSIERFQVNADPLPILLSLLPLSSPSQFHTDSQYHSIYRITQSTPSSQSIQPFVYLACLISFFFSSNRDLPPQGGYAPIRYKRNLPSKGPGGLVVFGGIIAICSFGFWKVGQSNLEQRSVSAMEDQRDLKGLSSVNDLFIESGNDDID